MEKKALSGKNVENDGREPHLRGMWEHFSCERRSKAKKFRQLADEEKRPGIQGQWQQESQAREYLEQVKCCHDTDCNESKMKKGFTALKNGTWEEFQETFKEQMKDSERAFDRIKEAFDLVAQDENEKMSIVQEIILRNTDFLWRIISPAGGQGGVTVSYLCPNCNSFPLEDYVWWVSGENPQSGGARCVEKSTTGSNQTGFWSGKLEKVLSRPRFSKRTRYLRAFEQI